MNKFIAIILNLFVIVSLYSQEDNLLVSKKGLPILPKSGEFGFGFDAIPVLTFFGDLIKINSGDDFDNRLEFSSPISPQLYLKYYLSSRTALRFKFRIAMHRENNTFPVTNDSNPAETLFDERLEYFYSFNIGAGIERRKGINRIQGFYGAEITTLFRNGTDALPNYIYKYSNKITGSNTAPSTALFADGAPRPLYEKSGIDFGIGARAFFGFEYFFAPKMAVGGEIGYGFDYIKEGKEKLKTEVWDATAGDNLITEVNSKKGSELNLDVEQGSTGIIYFIFHF